MIESPNDAWTRLARRHRLSDTTECRRAFYYGAKAGLEAASAISETPGPESWQLIEYEQALERFKRERC